MNSSIRITDKMVSLIKFIKWLTSYQHIRFFNSSSWIEGRDSEPNMAQLARVPEVFCLELRDASGLRRSWFRAISLLFRSHFDLWLDVNYEDLAETDHHSLTESFQYSLHNRRLMSQARRTWYFRRGAKRVRSSRRGEGSLPSSRTSRKNSAFASLGS